MKKALLSPVLLLLLAGALTGCARFYWSKPGASPEQFSQDNQACVQQTVAALPRGSASVDAARDYYRACLNSRGYVRDKQYEPPPPGFYRGIERDEEFNAAAQVAAMQAPRQSFEQQLAQLDDLKARGRITEAEYATMRKRLVDGVTPGALTPSPPPPAPPPPPVAAAPLSLAGRWNGSDRSVLEIRGTGSQLEWDWELVTDRTTTRASGTGSANGAQVSLIGRSSGQSTSIPPVSFSLAWEGDVLRGTYTSTSNLPRNVQFRRASP